MTEIADHPQLVERDRWQDVGSPVGPISMLVPPVEMSGVVPRMDPIPDVGDHTESILGDLGISPEKVAELHREGAI